MNTTWLAVGLLLVPPTMVARQGAGPQLFDGWTAEPGARSDATAGGILLRRGIVRTARLYSDFIFRFEFRQAQSSAEGRVLVRARVGYASERGYRVALSNRVDGTEALGRISGAEAKMQETGFAPARYSGSVGDWQECEIRVERDTLTVKVNGMTVSSAARLDEFTGYIALQATRGEGIEFKNLRAERLPSASISFGQGAHRATEPGVTPPRAVKTAKPFYPREPHDAWIQGVVDLELVVESTGAVGDIRVVRSLHPDLDEAAIASARQWHFSPGTRSGQAIPVIVTLGVSFRRTR